MAFTETQELIARLRLDDQLSGRVGRIGAGLNNLSGRIGRLQGGLTQMRYGVGQVAGGLLRLGAIAGTAAAAGISVAVAAASDFEAQMRVIATVAVTSGQATEQSLGTIGEGIRKLARDTGADLGDLTSAYYDLLSAGIKVADAQEVLTQAFALGRGALGSTNEAIDVLTTAINSYSATALYSGKTTAQLARLFSDQLAQAVEDGKVKLTDIAATFAEVAPLAAQAGLGVDQIAIALGVLSARGVPGAEVMTEMNRAIIELLKPNADLLALQDKVNKSYADLARQIGLVPALQQLRKDAERAGVPVQNLFGRLEGLKFVLATTGPNFAAFSAEADRVAHATDGTGIAAQQAAERQKGFAFEMARLRANLRDAAIAVGSGMTPALGRLADKLSDLVSKNGPQLEEFGKRIGEFIDQIDLEGLAREATSLAEIFRATVLPVLQAAKGGFDALPGPIKGVAVALAALSQLPGFGQIGAGLTNIAQGGIKVVISQFLARGASPANPLWVASVGGLGGATGGAAGGLLGKAATVLTVGLAAGASVEFGVTAANYIKGVASQTADVNKKMSDFLVSTPTREQAEAQLQALLRVPAHLDPIQKALFDINAGNVQGVWQKQVDALHAQISAIDSLNRQGGQRERTLLMSQERLGQHTENVRQAVNRQGEHIDKVALAIARKKLSVTTSVRIRDLINLLLTSRAGTSLIDKTALNTFSTKTTYAMQRGGVTFAKRPTAAIYGEAGDEVGIFLRKPRAGQWPLAPAPVVNVYVTIAPRPITRAQRRETVYRTYIAQ